MNLLNKIFKSGLLLMVLLSACDKPSMPPMEYYNSIHLKVMEVLDLTYQFEKAVYDIKPEQAQTIFTALQNTSSNYVKEIEEMKAYGMDNTLRKSAFDLLRFQKTFTDNEFAQVLDIYLNKPDSLQQAYTLIDQFYEMERPLNTIYEDKARQFWEKHDLGPKRKEKSESDGFDEED